MVSKGWPDNRLRFRQVRGPSVGRGPEPSGVFWVPSLCDELALNAPSRLVTVTLTDFPGVRRRLVEGRLTRFLFPEDGEEDGVVVLSALYRVVRVRYATSCGPTGPYRVVVATLLYVPPRSVRGSGTKFTVFTCMVGDRPAYALALEDGDDFVPLLDGKWCYCEDNCWFEVPDSDLDALVDALEGGGLGTIPAYRGGPEMGWSS